MNAILPGFVADNWFAMYFPAGTAKEIVASINAAIRQAALDPKRSFAHDQRIVESIYR